MLTIQKSTGFKTGAALVIDALEAVGISKIFGYPGASILSVYNELAARKNFTHCLCRHEQACVHAAEGYARISGHAGVVLVTSGPGLSNTITGIADAYMDCTPLLILSGAPNDSEGKVFQNVDCRSVAGSIVKKVFIPSLDDNLYKVIIEAFQTANAGKKAPVIVQLARNVLEKIYDAAPQKYLHAPNNIENHDINLASFIRLLQNSQNPLIIAGGGAADSFEILTNFADKYNINIVSTLMGIGAVSSKSPFYKGMIGVNGIDAANKLIYSSDLIIAFGTAFSDRTTCRSKMFAGGTPVININIEPYKYNNVNVVLEINTYCEYVINRLLEQNISLKAAAPAGSCSQAPFKNVNRSNKMSTGEVLYTINSYTKELFPVIITDVGQHQMLAAQSFDFTKPKRFITSGGLGTMGFGLPASCGVHFADPDACIINITGDGSLQMNIQELATVKEYNIPVKIFVMNNGYLGMIRQTQEKLYNGIYYQSKMHNPDFLKLAEAYGIRSYRVFNISMLQNILPEIFDNQQPFIVDCITNEFETV